MLRSRLLRVRLATLPLRRSFRTLTAAVLTLAVTAPPARLIEGRST
jgi:hypothetical protein